MMGFEQYHEPASELSAETRSFARTIVSLSEGAEAINWYEQRISLEKNKERACHHTERADGRIQTFRDAFRLALPREAAVA